MKIHPASYVVAFALLALGAASVGPWAPSPFTSQTGTNTTAAAWRTALGASGTTGGSLTNTAMVGGSETGVTNSDLTASRAVVSSASKVLASSTVTTTELAHLSGVTGNVQTNIDARLSSASISGYVTNHSGTATNLALVGGTVASQTNLDLTASRVMVSDANGRPASSSVTPTTLAFLDATSSIQTQLDSKPTFAATNIAGLSHTNNLTAPNTITNSGNIISAASYGSAQQTAAYTGGTNVVIDASKALTLVTLTNTTHLSVTNITAGASFTVLLLQDSTGARAVTFDTTRWKFPSGVLPSVTTNANACDVLSGVSDPFGTNAFTVHNARFQ